MLAGAAAVRAQDMGRAPEPRPVVPLGPERRDVELGPERTIRWNPVDGGEGGAQIELALARDVEDWAVGRAAATVGGGRDGPFVVLAGGVRGPLDVYLVGPDGGRAVRFPTADGRRLPATFRLGEAVGSWPLVDGAGLLLFACQEGPALFVRAFDVEERASLGSAQWPRERDRLEVEVARERFRVAVDPDGGGAGGGRPWSFVHPAAPRLRVAESLLDFGRIPQGATRWLPLDVFNAGRRPLELELSGVGEGGAFVLDPAEAGSRSLRATVAPRQGERWVFAFEGRAPGRFEVRGALDSPVLDEPAPFVLRGEVVETPRPEPAGVAEVGPDAGAEPSVGSPAARGAAEESERAAADPGAGESAGQAGAGSPAGAEGARPGGEAPGEALPGDSLPEDAVPVVDGLLLEPTLGTLTVRGRIEAGGEPVRAGDGVEVLVRAGSRPWESAAVGPAGGFEAVVEARSGEQLEVRIDVRGRRLATAPIAPCWLEPAAGEADLLRLLLPEGRTEHVEWVDLAGRVRARLEPPARGRVLVVPRSLLRSFGAAARPRCVMADGRQLLGPAVPGWAPDAAGRR